MKGDLSPSKANIVDNIVADTADADGGPSVTTWVLLVLAWISPAICFIHYLYLRCRDPEHHKSGSSVEI